MKNKTKIEIKLSTGKICPKCGCESLEEYFPLNSKILFNDKNFHCVAGCGMNFGLSRLKNDKIKISFDECNRLYLYKRFKFTDVPSHP